MLIFMHIWRLPSVNFRPSACLITKSLIRSYLILEVLLLLNRSSSRCFIYLKFNHTFFIIHIFRWIASSRFLAQAWVSGERRSWCDVLLAHVYRVLNFTLSLIALFNRTSNDSLMRLSLLFSPTFMLAKTLLINIYVRGKCLFKSPYTRCY